MTEGQIRELFEVKLAHIAALNEAQSRDIAEIKTAVSSFAAGCRTRHEKLDREIADLRTEQAFSSGCSKGSADFATASYAKLGAIFTVIAVVVALVQWLLT